MSSELRAGQFSSNARHFRLDKRCGKSGIAPNKKCSKQTLAKAAAPAKATKSNEETVKKVAATAAIAGLATAAILNRKKWTATANEIWRRAAPFDPANSPKGAEYLSQGNNGTVWIAQDRKSIIKIPKHKGSLLGLDNEVALQIKLRKAGVSTPEIFAYDKKKGVVHMEFLDGYKPLASTLKAEPADVRSATARSFVEEMAKTHRAGFAHGDLTFNNVMVKDSKVSMIDWGLASTVDEKGIFDIKKTVSMARQLDPVYGRELTMDFDSVIADIGPAAKPTRAQIMSFWDRVDARNAARRKDSVDRLDRRCGKSGIARGKKCTKPTSPARNVALGVAAVALGGLTAAALLRRGGRHRTSPPRPSATTPGGALVPTRPPSGPASSSGPLTPKQLPGFAPRGLLSPVRVPQSKTQRMQANTQAAEAIARERIAQTAREEARRVAQIGNTMAAAGEAAGMRTKLTARNLRLRAEAARRRWEPGYRSPDKPRPQRMLAEGGEQPLQFSVNASQPLTPQRLELDPRRRRARGSGSQEG